MKLNIVQLKNKYGIKVVIEFNQYDRSYLKNNELLRSGVCFGYTLIWFRYIVRHENDLHIHSIFVTKLMENEEYYLKRIIKLKEVQIKYWTNNINPSSKTSNIKALLDVYYPFYKNPFYKDGARKAARKAVIAIKSLDILKLSGKLKYVRSYLFMCRDQSYSKWPFDLNEFFNEIIKLEENSYKKKYYLITFNGVIFNENNEAVDAGHAIGFFHNPAKKELYFFDPNFGVFMCKTDAKIEIYDEITKKNRAANKSSLTNFSEFIVEYLFEEHFFTTEDDPDKERKKPIPLYKVAEFE